MMLNFRFATFIMLALILTAGIFPSIAAIQSSLTHNITSSITITVHSTDLKYDGENIATRPDIQSIILIQGPGQVLFVMTPYSFEAAPNTQIILSVPSNPSRWRFTNLWDDHGTVAYRNLTLMLNVGEDDHDVTAFFTQNSSALTTGVASGKGSVVPHCESACQYQIGSASSNTAIPAQGWTFSSWSIAGASCSGGPSVNPCALTVPTNGVILYANFIPYQNTPTVTIDATTYAQGESIHFTAQGFTPNGPITVYLVGSVSFTIALNADGQGNVVGTMLVGANVQPGVYTFYLQDTVSGQNSNMVSVAITLGISYTITVETSPYGLDDPQGAGTYLQNTQITIDVGNVNGYTFLKWQRDGVDYSTQQSFQYIADGSHDFTAFFTQNFDFSIAASSDSATLMQGGSAFSMITVTLVSGSPQPVSLACSNGLPPGASCIFSPSPGIPSFSSAITLSALATTPTGNYMVTVTGWGGGITRITHFLMIVTPGTWNLFTEIASGSGSFSPSCSYGCRYHVGDIISITATPSLGYSFSSWTLSGASCSGGTSANPCQLVFPNHDVTVNANFKIITMSDRTARAIYWLLAQEVSYSQGATAYAAAVSSSDSNRAYTDDNARLAMALTLSWEFFRGSSQESTWCGYQNCPGLYDKIKVALNFVLNARNAESRTFYHYWDLTDGSWHESGALSFWDAAVLEGLSVVAAKLRWDTSLGIPSADFGYLDTIKSTVEEIINTWQPKSQQTDGSWLIDYPGPTQDTQIAENGMILAALVALSSYEMKLNNQGLSAQYAGWAQTTAHWILTRQERHTDRNWPNGGGYGGFYNNGEPADQRSAPNGRAAFGLVMYGLNIESLVSRPNPDRAAINDALKAWLDGFVARTHDDHWGPMKVVAAAGAIDDGYPKEAYAAAAMGTATLGGWNLLQDDRYRDWANKFFQWTIGNNEKAVDLQNALDRSQQTPDGFYLGINGPPSSTAINPDSNTETNSEMLQFMLTLDNSSVPWYLGQSPQKPPSPCIIATAAYGSELAGPVQFLRNFRDDDVDSTHLGHAFLMAFNAWYYSWAPPVAQVISTHGNLKPVVRISIIPLIFSLFVAHSTFQTVVPVNSEAAALLAGIVAGSLIGVMYLALPMCVVMYHTRRRASRSVYTVIMGVGLLLALLGTISHRSLGFAQLLTSIFVVEVVLLSPAGVARTVLNVTSNLAEPRRTEYVISSSQGS
jgi:hypothetical protein